MANNRMSEPMSKYWEKRQAKLDLEQYIHSALISANILIEEYGLTVDEVNKIISDAYETARTMLGFAGGGKIKITGMSRKKDSERELYDKTIIEIAEEV